RGKHRRQPDHLRVGPERLRQIDDGHGAARERIGEISEHGCHANSPIVARQEGRRAEGRNSRMEGGKWAMTKVGRSKGPSRLRLPAFPPSSFVPSAFQPL